MGLKQRQMLTYEYLLTFINEHGYPPSVREICKALDIKSTSTVHAHLVKLEEEGMILRDPTKPRALKIPELINRPEMLDIPVVGRITAGEPILAHENIEEYFQLPMNYVKHDNDLFMLKIIGESMIEAGVYDGDLAIIERVNSADNGEIVVALIESEATIKRFFKEKDHIRLQPENSSMEPILVPSCEILGKLVGLYRKF
ncbi:MAG: transcriptional repressor LexA [Clostridium sp.]|nr:transcriptional repressor LexA [Clostridium sp.]